MIDSNTTDLPILDKGIEITCPMDKIPDDYDYLPDYYPTEIDPSDNPF